MKFFSKDLEFTKETLMVVEMFRPARQMKFSFLESPVSRASVGGTVIETRSRLRGEDEELTRLCLELLRDLNLEELADRVVVEWNTRMRSCAGRAFWPKGLIQLNPQLTGISKAEVRQTLLHELAHLVAYERNPNCSIKSHGKEWQRACVEVGIPGEKATHELALPTRSLKRQWRYECPRCKKTFERVRKYKSAVACYDCCLKETGGSYHDSFRLNEIRLKA
ncbi:MAG: putative SprT family Zn-dependent metalloprotease [Akkermansiaceae bacterium]